MVYTVTFNPSIDYAVEAENFAIGETNRTLFESFRFGGKGINVSVVLHRLGVPSLALGFAGGFTGVALEDMVKATGVDTDFIRVSGNTRMNVKIKSGDETEINGGGAAVGQRELDALMQKISVLGGNDYLVLAGSVPRGTGDSVYADIIRRVKDRGARVIVDATGELLKKTLSLNPFLIKPSIKELGEVFGAEISTDGEAIEYAKKLNSLGARTVIVSMGERGAVMTRAGEETLSLPAPHGKLNSSVGAGDSLVAGFLAGYIRTGSYKDAFRLGVAAGSATVFSDGLATAEEIESVLRRMNV